MKCAGMPCPWCSALGKVEIMANSYSKKNSFFGGAAILTAGIVIVKLIGALYKIPLGNIISEAAFADFNTAYYIYSLLIIVSTGGLPVALSKLVSEANALGRGNQVRKVFRLALPELNSCREYVFYFPCVSSILFTSVRYLSACE